MKKLIFVLSVLFIFNTHAVMADAVENTKTKSSGAYFFTDQGPAWLSGSFFNDEYDKHGKDKESREFTGGSINFFVFGSGGSFTTLDFNFSADSAFETSVSNNLHDATLSLVGCAWDEVNSRELCGDFLIEWSGYGDRLGEPFSSKFISGCIRQRFMSAQHYRKAIATVNYVVSDSDGNVVYFVSDLKTDSSQVFSGNITTQAKTSVCP